MESLTRSSNARARNDAARGSLLLGLLALALPVAAYAAARQLDRVSLVQATVASSASAKSIPRRTRASRRLLPISNTEPESVDDYWAQRSRP